MNIIKLKGQSMENKRRAWTTQEIKTLKANHNLDVSVYIHLLPNRTVSAIRNAISKYKKNGFVKEYNGVKFVKAFVTFLKDNEMSQIAFHRLTVKYGYDIHPTALNRLIKLKGERKPTKNTMDIIEGTVSRYIEETKDVQNSIDFDLVSEEKIVDVKTKTALEIAPDLDLFSNVSEEGLVGSLEKSLEIARTISQENFKLKVKVTELEDRLLAEQKEGDALIGQYLNLQKKYDAFATGTPSLINENKALVEKNTYLDEINSKLEITIEDLKVELATAKLKKGLLGNLFGK